MRFTTALLFAGVASASFVTRQTVPQCALTCIASADLGGCSATDNVCLCSNAAFISSTTTCIQSTCQGDDLTNAEAFAQATCEAVGVTLTASSSAAGSASSTSGSAASTTPTSPSSSSTSKSSSASSTSTSASASASSTTSSSAAKATGIPVFAAAALGLVAFAL